MRYLVYALVIVNIALFAWHRFAPVPAAATAYPLAIPPGIDRLVLLSEREQPETPQAETKEPDAPAVMAPEETVPPETEQPQAVTAAAPELICQTVGPFLDKRDATEVFGLLATQGLIVNIRDGDVREPAGYWVYLPAMPASKARSIVADLDRQGMKDYFIGKQNHISLGIFSEVDKARTRQKTVQELGYDAVLDQRYRLRDVFWLDVEESDKPLLSSDIWAKVQSLHPDVRVQKVSCE